MTDQPDWPPRGSAFNHSEGHQQRGSTGQLWEVRNGQWVRVPEPPPIEASKSTPFHA